jgi:dTDP-4-dehydrorhamnose reductase
MLEMWGGVECTVNRVGDTYHNQLERSGHASRNGDLERIAQLGIAALRYPILWETTAPDGLDRIDWRWADERMALLRDLRLRPIVGLLHHGSGPRDTSLLDPGFPQKLAAYAGAVAARYPEADAYVPVNEPLTTARFSGMYGVWHPHSRNEADFIRALLNQCKGVVLAMEAVRAVNAGARLVQTDDLGKTHATQPVLYQAAFNNELRWLGWDLLCGRVGPDHALWPWLTSRCGAQAADLLWFADHPCRPDILGVNYYVTSERLLDHDLAAYPAALHGGNGRDRYVDIESVCGPDRHLDGLGSLLDEAWQRYRLPIAVTEAHIDATRDDQLRWLAETWDAADDARRRGVDVRAVTAWSLLGSFDWNCLVTANRGYYEPGAFDLRAPEPRMTAVGRLIQALAKGSKPDHPVLRGPGWWKRPRKRAAADDHEARSRGNAADAPILIAGGTGNLGRAFARICMDRGLSCVDLSRAQMDITDPPAVQRMLEAHRPWAMINAAGYARVDRAETEADRCYRENITGACVLASECARSGLPLVTFSSAMVFDGSQSVPYLENHRARPLNIYGRSKAAAESQVLARHPQALVVRTSGLFGPWDDTNPLSLAMRALCEGREVTVCNEQTLTPTYVPDLVHACLDLMLDGESGLLHLTHGEPTSWAALIAEATRSAGIDAALLRYCAWEEQRTVAPRPRYSALASSRVNVLPPLASALDRYLSLRHPAQTGGRR